MSRSGPPPAAAAELARPGSPELAALAAAVRAGGVLLLPTDTCYILAADARSPAAVGRVFELKGRPARAPIHVLVPEAADLDRWGRMTPVAQALARACLPGALTLVLERRPGLAEELTAGLDTIGLRLPADPTARLVAAAAGVPLTATSANLSGRPAPYSLAEALAGLGAAAAELAGAVDGGRRPAGGLSTVVDARRRPVRVLRAGSVSAAEIEAAVVGTGSKEQGEDDERR